jgi:hypothetical protein
MTLKPLILACALSLSLPSQGMAWSEATLKTTKGMAAGLAGGTLCAGVTWIGLSQLSKPGPLKFFKENRFTQSSYAKLSQLDEKYKDSRWYQIAKKSLKPVLIGTAFVAGFLASNLVFKRFLAPNKDATKIQNNFQDAVEEPNELNKLRQDLGRVDN